MIARIFLSCFFIWICCICLSAQQEDINSIENRVVAVEEDEPQVEEKLIEPELKMLPHDYMDSLKAKSEFDYVKNLDSLLKNYKEIPVAEPASKKKSSFLDIGLIRILLWSLAIFGVIYILYQLIAGQGQLFYKNKRFEVEIQNEHTKDLKLSPLQLSQQAAERGDFRQAVRYQYVYLLQLLGERKHVVILPQKTSQHYLTELKSKPFSSDISRLTIQYEYVWFGHIHPNKEQYELIQQGYRNFMKKWL